MQLQEEYDEILGYLNSYSQHIRRQEELIRYLHNYIHWKALDDEFAFYRNMRMRKLPIRTFFTL